MANAACMRKVNIASSGNALCDSLRAQFAPSGYASIADAAMARARKAGYGSSRAREEQEMTFLVKAPVTSSDFKKNHSVGELRHIHVPGRDTHKEMRKRAKNACSAMVANSAHSLSDRRSFNDIAKFSDYKKSVKMRAPMPAGVVASIMLCAMLLAFVVHSAVSISEVTRSTSELESRIAMLSETQSDLALSLDARGDLRTIEQIATEEMGMVHKDYVLRKYVEIYSQDQIDVYDTEGGENDSTFLSAIVEKIKEYMN